VLFVVFSPPIHSLPLFTCISYYFWPSNAALLTPLHLLEHLSNFLPLSLWCDRMASNSWSNGSPSDFAPEVNPDEKWVVNASFPQYHKLIGSLTGALTDSLHYETTLQFICQTHGLMPAKLSLVNLCALQCNLRVWNLSNVPTSLN